MVLDKIVIRLFGFAGGWWWEWGDGHSWYLLAFVVVSMECGFMMFFFGLKIGKEREKEENGNWV